MRTIKTFEFNKETVNNIVTATKYDKIVHKSRWGNEYETSVVNEQLAEMNRRGEVLAKIMNFFKECPKAKVRMKTVAKAIYGDEDTNYINHLMQKLVQGGFLKKEVEEQAMMITKEVYISGKGYQKVNQAVLAKTAYFSLAE